MKIPVKDYRRGEILIHKEHIAQSLKELAAQISKDYGNPFLLVGILKGACMVMADLQRALYEIGCKNFQVSFISVKSYHSGTESSKSPHLLQDIDFDPKNNDILLVDDIIDTGISLQFLSHMMQDRQAKSVRSFALLSKPDRREVDYEADYVGFTIPNVWVEGYGMDSDERGRSNPNIIIGPSYEKD